MAGKVNGANLAGKRIGLLTASASRLGGGVFEAVVAQADMLRGLGAEPVVFALRDEYSAADIGRFGPSAVHFSDIRGPGIFGYAPRLLGSLERAGLDLLHLHGIWMYPSHAGTAWAKRSGKPYLISPHGMLDPWITRRGRWKKALARLGYERASWRQASAFHALTSREANDIHRESDRSETLVIANPGPQPNRLPATRRLPTIVYLGRIHPKKNLAALIAAWTNLAARGELPDDARLKIAGWGDDAHVADLRSQLARAPSSATYIGPAYGRDKEQLLREARFLVLPSLSEGLPVAILEAWAAATPVLMSSECNLADGFEAGAAFDTGTTVRSIEGALRRGMDIDATEWLAMAKAARSLAAGPFSAQSIAAAWAATYESLLESVPR